MEIYLSSETEGRADSLLLPIRNMVDSLLDDIRKNEYGSALTSVGVFAIIMKEEMYDSGGYCERQYYSKVRKEADIRLRLNYKSFCNAEPEKRVELYEQHVSRALEIAADKAKIADPEFQRDKLVYDVIQAFGLTEKEEKVKNKSTVIYLAGETEERAVKCFREVMQVVDPMLDEIRARSYGNALRELGIFAVIMKESSYEESCWKEKRYYSATKTAAEVRLRINYRNFVFAKPENQINMYKELIIRAFEIAVERIQKIDKQFCGEELLCDVNKALGAVKRNLYWV